MKFYFCETCGKRITDQEINEGLGRDKKLKGVYCNQCATGVSTLVMLPLTDDEARERLKAQRTQAAAESDAGIPAPSQPLSGAAAPSASSKPAHRTAPPIDQEPPERTRTRTLFAAAACAALLCAGVLAVVLQGSPDHKTPTKETKSAAAPPPQASGEKKQPAPVPAPPPQTPLPPPRLPPPVQPAPVAEPKTVADPLPEPPQPDPKKEEKTPDPPHPTEAETPAPASADAAALVRRVLSGEVLKATDEYYVEVRYDFVKNKDASKDFDGPIKAQADGLAMKGFAHWEKEFGNSKVLRYTPLFQAKTLRVEYLIAPAAGHDIEIVRMGDAHVKMRWTGGQVLTTYQPRFTGDIYGGNRWNHPDPKGAYRYVAERAPGEVTLRLNEAPVAKETLPTQAQNEKTWFTTFATNQAVVIKEFVVKGYLDPGWLKEQAQNAKP